jgi:hypothetical protein
MAFQPVDMPQGYGQAPQLNSWGGGILYDSPTETYHLFVSAMTNDCPLSDWNTNSRIEHATSLNPTGPYTFQDVAVNTYAHNSAPLLLPDGTYAIVHIGDGAGPADGGVNCSTSDDATPPSFFHGIVPHKSSNEDDDEPAAAGSTIHVSTSLNGPWEPLSQNTLPGCNNPAPWVHPNGTLFSVCSKHNDLLRADSISGPWTNIANVIPMGGPGGSYEDPFLYTDFRGNFHVLFHVYNTSEPFDQCANSTVSAHSFSADGLAWHTAAAQPYGTQVTTTTNNGLGVGGGGVVTVSTRERPKLLFNSDGVPTHLLNGVCSASAWAEVSTPCVNCKYNYDDYTLVQPFDLTPAAARL